MASMEISELKSVDQLSKHIFLELHRAIIRHEEGARIGDVDAVHDMRVSIRRLRVALGNFAICLSREDRQRLRSRLENLAGAMGGVRDLDVMIGTLTRLLSNRTGDERRAIAALIGRLRSRRRSRLRKLVNYLNGEEYMAFKREFSEASEPGKQVRSNGQAF